MYFDHITGNVTYIDCYFIHSLTVNNSSKYYVIVRITVNNSSRYYVIVRITVNNSSR